MEITLRQPGLKSERGISYRVPAYKIVATPVPIYVSVYLYFY
jgi:hypothetical protein